MPLNYLSLNVCDSSFKYLFFFKCLFPTDDFNSPGHNQNWIYSDVIELHKMAPTLREAICGHISALFSDLKCSFPTVLWDFRRFYTWNRWNWVCFRARIFLTRHQTSKEIKYVAIFSVFQKISVKFAYNFLEFGGIFVLVQDFLT